MNAPIDTSSQRPSGVFVNSFTHSLDPKKRLTVPSEWRDSVGLPARLFIIPGFLDPCLFVYPARDLMARLDDLRKLSTLEEDGRMMARSLASAADLVTLDHQGRIRIKDELLEHAHLADQVMLVGTFDGFELWNPERWANVAKEMEPSMAKDAARQIGLYVQ